MLLSRNFSQINILMNFYSILCSEVKDFLDFQLLKMVEKRENLAARGLH